jgi:hypothetical protein
MAIPSVTIRKGKGRIYRMKVKKKPIRFLQYPRYRRR